MMEYSFQRYLTSKRTVDDRALNGMVWETLKECLGQEFCSVVELGAGTGTMFQRMVERQLLTRADYSAVDSLPDNILQAQVNLPIWASKLGWDWRPNFNGISMDRDDCKIDIHLIESDVFDFAAANKGRQWDLLIAHAFLDLLDIPTALPTLLKLVRPGGLIYFTINFDGLTILEPAIDRDFDELIQKIYHRTMDERITDGHLSGDSQTGRHLIKHLNQCGVDILAAGSSDWVVFPNHGSYPADEAYFLHFIVHTVEHALGNRKEIDSQNFKEWIIQRHAQIDRGELTFIAHQLDFLGRA